MNGRSGTAEEVSAILQRYLDDLETRMWNRPYVQAFEYHGRVDPGAFAHAVEGICARYPVLRGRIRREEHGHLLYVPVDHRPELLVTDGDVRTLDSLAARPWDPACAVARFMLVQGERQGLAGLQADHAIIDGRSWTAMFRQLWSLYSDIVNGADVAVDRGESLPLSPRALIDQRWRGAKLAQRPEGSSEPEARAHSRAINTRFRLSEDETTRLVAFAREQETSVHAIICGAILIAQRLEGIQPDGSAPMVCWSLIDLRNRVTPPVGATDTANFLGVHRAELEVAADASPVSVGRAVRTQLDTALARHEIRPGGTLIDLPTRVETSLEQRFAAVCITNGGVTKRFETPPGLTITGRRTVPPASTRTVFPIFRAHTYNGRLNITSTHSSAIFTDDEVERLVKRTKEQLRDIGFGESRR